MIRHFLPSQRSMSVPASEPPTATHLDSSLQETPLRNANCAAAGFGVGKTVHFLPFHRSASVTSAPALFT
jgi:hypothetical protein